jgi:two-component system chemotaxis response regulator CheY
MKKVLIVDDSLTVRMYHKQILTKDNFECDEAENGMEALEKSQVKNYDLYLVDINMPIMDGYSFVRKLREEKNPTPVVMVSTESENKDKEMAYRSGASMYIIKPANPKELSFISKILTRE